jgi:chemotaxis protein MotB
VRKKEEEAKQGAPDWMVTYGDMVTLLLCFFVLLFSMSTVDAKKFKSVIEAFQGSLGVLTAGKTIDDSELMSKGLNDDDIKKQLQEAEDFQELQEQIEDYLEEEGIIDDVEVTNNNSGLLLRFSDNALFDSGRAIIKEPSRKTLSYIAELLKKEEFSDKNIRVEGHTDNDQIVRGSKYETNWELSVSRASNVVRFFIEQNGLKPTRFSAAGYSEYHPVAPNDSVENKAKNRRVDILIVKKTLENESIDLED